MNFSFAKKTPFLPVKKRKTGTGRKSTFTPAILQATKYISRDGNITKH